ncbi:uncharacterized protein LOC118262681 [Spodoptera frugiperda]|uniref:Uncharacterized protein LOC118262681 n=1 Tax=Spodoptera frugiperda TaxID=7108 RepID=A0A9R0CUY9_SPOFR|nr:uncharacterized protein LOC118262681 [Spodoptera frugiperda]
MKFLCLVSLIVCAFAHGAEIENDLLSTVDHVENHLENTHLELHFLANEENVSEDAPALEYDDRQTRLVADAIAQVIEDFRDVVINGNDNLPPLDPLEIPVIGPFDFKAPATTAQVTVNNFRMEGLQWYVLDSINFNAIRLAFGAHVTIPWVTSTGTYEARARLGLLTHKAGGNFRIFAHRIEVGLDIRVGTKLFGGTLYLRELNIKIDIHDTHIQIHGMTGSNIINGFINGFIQNITQDIIQSEMENVSQALSEELFDVINDALKDFTINDIMG